MYHYLIELRREFRPGDPRWFAGEAERIHQAMSRDDIGLVSGSYLKGRLELLVGTDDEAAARRFAGACLPSRLLPVP